MAKTANFWYNFAKKGYTPLSDFYQIWLGEGVPVLLPPAKFHRCGLKNMGLQPPKSPKLVFFGINLPKSGIPPYAIFFTKFNLGKGVPGPHRQVRVGNTDVLPLSAVRDFGVYVYVDVFCCENFSH